MKPLINKKKKEEEIINKLGKLICKRICLYSNKDFQANESIIK